MLAMMMVFEEIIRAKAEQDAFRTLCDRLPENEATRLRKRRRRQMKLKQSQRDRIAVAKAGRSRNFWGNY